MLPIVNPKYAGLDVHKKFVTTYRIIANGQRQRKVQARTFSTMTDDLEALRTWLAEGGVTHVAMESTGVFWQPIHNRLEDDFTVYLVNGQTVKRMAGRKTDMKDAEWLAILMEHGLLQPDLTPKNRFFRTLRAVR